MSNEELKQQFVQLLQGLKGNQTKFEVRHGVVTLWGRVRNPAEMTAINTAVQGVSGVIRVRSALESPIAMAADTDEGISAAARHALRWKMRGESANVRCSVAQGRIVLEGDVLSQAGKTAAERAVRHLARMSSVVNRLQVMHPA